MVMSTRLRLTLAQVALLAGGVALPRLARRVFPPSRPSGDRASPVARTAAGALSVLLLGAPAAYALAGYALRPATEALAREERFAVAASHELRTPLTVLLGTLEAALLRRRTPAQYEDVLRRATAEAIHVSDLLDAVLSLAHAEGRGAAPLGVEPLDLRPVVRAAVEGARAAAADKGHTLVVALRDPLPVRGNARALHQAVSGLLDNAVIYTSPGGTIRLEGRRARGRALLAVHDNGPGIAPEHLPRLCEPFYRVDPARPESTEHAGLGLTQADRITRAHRGRLAVDSQVGVGSVFTLSLPLDHVGADSIDAGRADAKTIATTLSH